MSLKQPNLKLLISEEEIATTLADIAQALNQIYRDKEVVIIAVLKGSICLMADLMRLLTFSLQLEFIHASSYGQRGTERGDLTTTSLPVDQVKGKDLLLVDDIYDSGITLSTILSSLEIGHPNTLKSLVLLKKNVTHRGSHRPDYVCFDIEDDFVVGYGLDYKEHYRELAGVYKLEL